MRTKKTTLALACLVLFTGLGVGTSYAMTYNFTPDPANLFNLAHGYAYSWGIRWMPKSYEYITAAQIVFKNIHNWRPEADDHLYVRLLENAPEGVQSFRDYQNPSDYFAGQGAPLFKFTDLDDNLSSETLVHNFAPWQVATLEYWAKDNDFGFGFDPDCHYYNCGIELNIETGVVPEPATIGLFGIGLLGLFGLRRRS